MSPRLGKRILLPCLILSMLLLAAASAVFAHLNLHLPRRPLPPLEAAQKSYPQASWRDASLTTTDGVTLRAWYGTPPNPSSRCVVILHGIIDNRSGPMGLAPMFLNAQYTVLLPDTRGHGVSGGELSTYGLYEKHDLVAWTNWLHQAGCQSVYGLGESLGAAILLQASAEKPVFRAVIAECSFADLGTIAKYRLAGMLPISGPLARTAAALVIRGAVFYTNLRYGLNLDEASPARALARSNTATLLIHGLADTKTPPSHSQALAAANSNATLWLVPGATHTAAARTDPAGFETRALDFFAQHP